MYQKYVKKQRLYLRKSLNSEHIWGGHVGATFVKPPMQPREIFLQNFPTILPINRIINVENVLRLILIILILSARQNRFWQLNRFEFVNRISWAELLNIFRI